MKQPNAAGKTKTCPFNVIRRTGLTPVSKKHTNQTPLCSINHIYLDFARKKTEIHAAAFYPCKPHITDGSTHVSKSAALTYPLLRAASRNESL